MATIEQMQEAFDWALENGVTLEVHEIMEAVSAGLTHKMDILDFCLGMDAAALAEERESL